MLVPMGSEPQLYAGDLAEIAVFHYHHRVTNMGMQAMDHNAIAADSHQMNFFLTEPVAVHEYALDSSLSSMKLGSPLRASANL
jgi:hypothetical protein